MNTDEPFEGIGPDDLVYTMGAQVIAVHRAGDMTRHESLNDALENANPGSTVTVYPPSVEGVRMNAQAFGRTMNDEQAELARLRLFLAQAENIAYRLPEGSQTRKDLLAAAHEARGLKPDEKQRTIVAEGD